MATLNVNPDKLKVGQRYSIETTSNEVIEGTFSIDTFPGLLIFENCTINNRTTNNRNFSPKEYIAPEYIKRIYVTTINKKLPGELNQLISQYLGGKKYKKYRSKTIHKYKHYNKSKKNKKTRKYKNKN